MFSSLDNYSNHKNQGTCKINRAISRDVTGHMKYACQQCWCTAAKSNKLRNRVHALNDLVVIKTFLFIEFQL